MPYADITTPPAPLPSAEIVIPRPGISRHPPLSRRGSGPGLILLTTSTIYDEHVTQTGDAPTAVLKWAEEGYTVLQVLAAAIHPSEIGRVLTEALETLESCTACQPKGKVGLICFSEGLWNLSGPTLAQCPQIVAVVVYVDCQESSLCENGRTPILKHITGPSRPSCGKTSQEPTKEYYYPAAKKQWFAPGSMDFDYAADSVAHTRNLQFLKPKMHGPYFDLEAIWEEHTYYEFADRSVEHTMSTMVQEPYVNHVPTLTGGVGRANLATFYRDNFIFNNSADTSLELVSRTIGIDRVIDEFIFNFTHDRQIDWLLPGVPPTYCQAAIPFTAVVNIRGDRLYHEHISWDQGTTLRQLGLLPEYLPFPYPLPGDMAWSKGAKAEFRVPVLGVQTANKLRDRRSEPSNEMFGFTVREKEE